MRLHSANFFESIEFLKVSLFDFYLYSSEKFPQSNIDQKNQLTQPFNVFALSSVWSDVTLL